MAKCSSLNWSDLQTRSAGLSSLQIGHFHCCSSCLKSPLLKHLRVLSCSSKACLASAVWTWLFQKKRVGPRKKTLTVSCCSSLPRRDSSRLELTSRPSSGVVDGRHLTDLDASETRTLTHCSCDFQLLLACNCEHPDASFCRDALCLRAASQTRESVETLSSVDKLLPLPFATADTESRESCDW